MGIKATEQEGSKGKQQQSFSKLIDIFDAIDVHEKGIEQVYHYLLTNQIIEDIKKCSDDLDLPIKRVYKIFSVLKEISLIQVYDRPMKIILNPPLSAWETIISDRIQLLRNQLNEKVHMCESAFKQMVEAYNLRPSQPSIPPVEFISNLMEEDPMDFLFNPLIAEHEVLMAKGIKYENQVADSFANDIKKGIIKLDSNFIGKWHPKMEKVKYFVLVSEEFLEDVLQYIKKINIPEKTYQDLEKFDVSAIRYQVYVVERPFSNFIIKDSKELLQFSVDPSNNYLGLFISRQKEIVDVFSYKFNELKANAITLKAYLDQKKYPPLRNLDKILFAIY